MVSFIDRTGEVRRNKESLGGYEMKIVKYNNNRDIWVEFQDEHKAKVHTQYYNFKNGSVSNPYYRSVYNVGYIGQGKYSKATYLKIYQTWQDMLRRCYNENERWKAPTYEKIIVEEYFHCFQNYAKWYEENKYECNNEKMEIDKDILEKGNKIYDRTHMIFVPKRINDLFIKCDASRGEYPIGVYWDKRKNKFRAQCRILNEEGKSEKVELGYYETPEKAFYKYKKFKENYIKQVADEYYQADLIPERLYWAMYWWEVNIDD